MGDSVPDFIWLLARNSQLLKYRERCRPDALMIRVKPSRAGYFLPTQPMRPSLPCLTASRSGGEGRPKGRHSNPAQGEEKRLEEPRLGVD